MWVEILSCSSLGWELLPQNAKKSESAPKGGGFTLFGTPVTCNLSPMKEQFGLGGKRHSPMASGVRRNLKQAGRNHPSGKLG